MSRQSWPIAPTRSAPTLLLPALLIAVLSAGCGGVLQPRTSAPMAWAEWAEAGAMVDASRGHPIAFWADAGRAPAEVEIAGSTLYPAQWLTHVALRMNQAIDRKTLLDSRFAAVSPKLFTWELSSGRYSYTYRAKPLVTVRLIQHSRTRAVELRFSSVNPVKMGSDTGVRVMIDVFIGSAKRSYAAESSKSVGWDVACMDAIARQILGDERFWNAVRFTK